MPGVDLHRAGTRARTPPNPRRAAGVRRGSGRGRHWPWLGLLTGIAAGAWFGTLIIPVAGTLFGAAFGGVFAVTPTLVCTIVAAMVLATVDRRDPDPLRVRRHLAAWSAATSGFVALVVPPISPAV